MKYVSILFISIFFSFISTAQNSKINPKIIIGKTIIIGNLEVAQNDFPRKMNWDDAKIDCKRLGIGWRLPTKGELNIIYQNKSKIGDFENNFYWSSTESPWLEYAYLQDFQYGQKTYTFKVNLNYVRAIRTIK